MHRNTLAQARGHQLPDPHAARREVFGPAAGRCEVLAASVWQDQRSDVLFLSLARHLAVDAGHPVGSV